MTVGLCPFGEATGIHSVTEEVSLAWLSGPSRNCLTLSILALSHRALLGGHWRDLSGSAGSDLSPDRWASASWRKGAWASPPVPAQVGTTTPESFLDSRHLAGESPWRAVLRGHKAPDTSDSPHRRAEPLQEPPGGLPKSPCAGPEAKPVRGTARWSDRPEGTPVANTQHPPTPASVPSPPQHPGPEQGALSRLCSLPSAPKAEVSG